MIPEAKEEEQYPEPHRCVHNGEGSAGAEYRGSIVRHGGHCAVLFHSMPKSGLRW